MSDNHSIYDYFDYRSFLADYYAAMKKAQPGFSHRSFLAKAGIPGTVYLQRVMTGQRRISRKYIAHFIAALELSEREAEYFRAQVTFCNSKPGEGKERALRQMLLLRDSTPHRRIEDRKLRYFDKWYAPIIRGLVTVIDFKEDYNLLASLIYPRISARQARGAVIYLVENGFIRKGKNGRYEWDSPVVTTGDEVNSTILRKYHRTCLLQSADALDDIPQADRDVSLLTLTVSKATYARIKHRIQQFRKELLGMATSDPEPDMVASVGVQLLPRSKQFRGGGKR